MLLVNCIAVLEANACGFHRFGCISIHYGASLFYALTSAWSKLASKLPAPVHLWEVQSQQLLNKLLFLRLLIVMRRIGEVCDVFQGPFIIFRGLEKKWRC